MAIALWLPRYKQPEETKVKGRGSEVGACWSNFAGHGHRRKNRIVVKTEGLPVLWLTGKNRVSCRDRRRSIP